MRLKPEKVEDMCRQVTETLKNDARVKFLVPTEQVEATLRKLLLADLQREEELMAEVDKIMDANRNKIAGKNIDVQIMRRKIRGQLARQRKIVL